MSCKYSTPFQSVNNKIVAKMKCILLSVPRVLIILINTTRRIYLKKRWHLRLTDALINLIVEVDNDIISAISYCL